MDTSVQRIEKAIEELTAKVSSIEQKMTGVMIVHPEETRAATRHGCQTFLR